MFRIVSEMIKKVLKRNVKFKYGCVICSYCGALSTAYLVKNVERKIMTLSITVNEI